MDTKWKKSKVAVGFLCFLLGVSLLLEGGLYFWSSLSSSSSRQWLKDSFQADWQDTQEFRNFVCARLQNFIAMGAGGGTYGYLDDYEEYRSYHYVIYKEEADALHKAWKDDKNILYRVEAEGELLYRNSDDLSSGGGPGSLPEGYGFLIQFDGKKARIWKDGAELDVYGDGYYRPYDNGGELCQWFVPGYKNFTIGEAGSRVTVTMAVIDEPQVFIRGRYGTSDLRWEEDLYNIRRNLKDDRSNVIGHVVTAGAGLGLFLAYLFLRKEKKQADQVLARGTGKIWFEVKLLAALLLVFFCLPRPVYLGEIWSELTYAYSPSSYGSASADVIPGEISQGNSTAQIASLQIDKELASAERWEAATEHWGLYPVERTTSIGTAVTILSENGGWLLREYLRELAGYSLNLLAVFWGLYLLIFNDWRYNRRPWRRGIIAMLAAWGLNLPIQKRLSRVCGVTAIMLLLLGAINVNLLVYVSSYRGSVPLEAVWAIVTPAALLLLVCAILIWRLCRLWTDLGAVSDLAAAIRAGELEGELALQENSDLSGLAGDLNHIRQGLHQAVEERTRSERMKVELVTNVSHDLKTPLTAIISYTELLAQESLEPPASEYVQIMGEKAQRLKAMVQDVFEVSKAASGQLPVKLEPLDYARLLRQTLADMAQAIDNSGVTLRASIPEEEVPITADSDRLYRVFQNLIGNALKYSLPGSRVYLSLAVEKGQATASVRNTSSAELKPGMDYIARFVRGDESRTDGGSGLGLSIAESFTRACGGELTISTQADLFTVAVTFPISDF